MSTNLEYRARERQRQRESRRQAREAQREKWRQRSRARDKKQRKHFFVGRTTWKFCSDGDKMGNASGHQCKVKISDSEKKVNKKTHDTSSIKRVTRSFWMFRVVVVQNNGKENVQKKCAARAKFLFLLIRPIVLFYHSPALPSPLSITRFYIFFNKL